ncbi:MAG: MBL fold metallo-hydrolase [Burkholderiales bacterium]|nr:MBL fold metallo-hydrolase [Burkholderiales bacterium]
MKTFALLLLRSSLAAGAVALLASCAAPAPDASALLARSSQAMGAAQVTTLRYVAEGTGYTFGQAYKAGGAWPKITLHSMTRSIDYGSGTMRDEIVLSRAEPLGGGGYPLSGQQRNDQFVSGEIAWNVAGTTATPGPRFVTDRIHQLWITPHGVLKAASQGKARASAGDSVTFDMPGRFTATAFIGPDGLVRRVESTFADPVLGDTPVVTTYSDYRATDGVQFPMRIQQTMGGHPVLELAVKEVQVNPALAMAVPDAARNVAERVTSEKVAEGVWFVAGGSHNSVAIELQDRLILVEAPLNDARTLAVIEHVKGLVPGKPIRMVVNTHQHFDHAGGVRAAVAEGAIIVTQADNIPYFERAFAQANRIRPDAMAGAGKRPSFLAVPDKLEIGDSVRPVQLHRIAGGPHSDSFLMVYLPVERLLIEADAFTPPPPNTPPPAVANANNVNLVDNIERLKLSVLRILPLHGRVVSATELYAATQRTPR